MRIIAAWLVLQLTACSTTFAGGNNPIRVLVFGDAQSVQVSTERGGILVVSGEGRRTLRPPVRIEWTGDRLRLNGQPVAAGPLLLRSDAADLMVATPRGAMRVGGWIRIVDEGRMLQVVNEVDLEEYVKGVVPSEMNAAWHQEALKVQAVATRSYAVHQQLVNATREYDVVATVQDQVYRGRERPDLRVDQAVESTRDLVLTYEGEPIFAAFSSTAAGPTEDAFNVWAKDLPYLKGVDCPFDANSPYYQWSSKVSAEELELTLRKQGIALGSIQGISIFTRSKAGRATRIKIRHANGELVIRGEELRRIIGYRVIPSTQFDVRLQDRDIVISGRGAGHGVGLCQWGAKELAELGYSYRVILNYYFPGTELKDLHKLSLSRPLQP